MPVPMQTDINLCKRLQIHRGARLSETVRKAAWASQSLMLKTFLKCSPDDGGFKLHGRDFGGQILHVVVDDVPANLVHTRCSTPHCHHGQVA
eukprot:6479005-Amphidinium_carterae.1